MADRKHLLQQRITTSAQNAVIAHNDGDRRRMIFLDLEAKVDGTYYYDLLLS